MHAMTASTIKTWCWIHKWSSLVSTVFMLLLCVTGLPLIFHHEIDELLGNAAEPRDLPAGTPHASLDRMVKAALDRFPGQVVQYVVWDARRARCSWRSALAKTPDAHAGFSPSSPSMRAPPRS